MFEDLSALEFIDVILQQLTQREACLNTAIFTISVTDYKVIDSSSSPRHYLSVWYHFPDLLSFDCYLTGKWHYIT